jgi:hypothetical protein
MTEAYKKKIKDVKIMERYQRKFSESESFAFQKKYYEGGLPSFKTMIVDVYQSMRSDKSEISKFKLNFSDFKTKTDGIVFISKIESEQEFSLKLNGKEVLKGRIIIFSEAEKINKIMVKGSVGNRLFEIDFL